MNTEKKIGITELLGIDPDSNISNLIEGATDYIPYIGKVYNAIKWNRLQARLKKIEDRITSLSSSLVANENGLLNKFIRTQAFPIALEQLLEEHEEEKVDLIMNGIEFVYKEEIRDESKILIYFDVLQELRVDELKRLMKHGRNSVRYKTIADYNEENYPSKDEDIVKFRENQSYLFYIDNHLEKLGLIDNGMKNIQKSIDDMYKEINNIIKLNSTRRLSKSHFVPTTTQFGDQFIEFFCLSILIQLPAE